MVELMGQIWARSALAGILLVVALGVYVVAAVLLSYVDFREHRLPNKILFPSFLAAVPLLLAAALVLGEPLRALGVILGGVGAFALFFLIRFIRPAAMGFGDVKLVAFLGAYLGFVSFEAFAWALMLAFLSAGLVSLVLIVAKKATGKSTIAFGPYLILGSTLALIIA